MELEAIYRKDLNLLVALQVLLEERSVSRAAQRLNLSQSAMSRILGRLRALVADPLFVRQGQQLLPTERALALGQGVQLPLNELAQLLSGEAFEPTECRHTFQIATTDYAMQTILPFALPRIYQEAPHCALNFQPLRAEHLPAQLSHEGADLALCRMDEVPAPLCHEPLGPVSVFCMVADNHPLARQPLTLADYLRLPHAIIAISDGVKALIDQALADYPPRREVLRAYHLEAALAVAQQMPLVITVPADLAYLVAERYQLVIKPLPFPFSPFVYSMVWHPRCEHGAAQRWLRNLLKEECGRLINARIEAMGLIQPAAREL